MNWTFEILTTVPLQMYIGHLWNPLLMFIVTHWSVHLGQKKKSLNFVPSAQWKLCLYDVKEYISESWIRKSVWSGVGVAQGTHFNTKESIDLTFLLYYKKVTFFTNWPFNVFRIEWNIKEFR